MLLTEINLLKSDSDIPIAISNVYEYGSNFVINGYSAFKVIKSNSYDESNSIPLTLYGITQGELVFLKIKGEIEISSMTEFEFIAFLTYGRRQDYDLASYKFDFDVVLIKEEFLIDYLEDYASTSILWGSYLHEDSSIAPVYKKPVTNIELGFKLNPFDVYSLENANRAIQQPFAFERFLKFYHLLELQFDYAIIGKIKNLTIPTDSNKIGKILNEYSNKEIERLTDLLSDKCNDILSLENSLYKIINHQAVATDMFVNFSKSTNAKYLGDIIEFNKLFSLPNFSMNSLKPEKIKGYDFNNHDSFIIGLSAYWIYKIRCSIAHSKIGEYILTSSDEYFIVEFGEPLIKNVLLQFFKK